MFEKTFYCTSAFVFGNKRLSSANLKNGAYATSHGYPSGSRKYPEYPSIPPQSFHYGFCHTVPPASSAMANNSFTSSSVAPLIASVNPQ